MFIVQVRIELNVTCFFCRPSLQVIRGRGGLIEIFARGKMRNIPTSDSRRYVTESRARRSRSAFAPTNRWSLAVMILSAVITHLTLAEATVTVVYDGTWLEGAYERYGLVSGDIALICTGIYIYVHFVGFIIVNPTSRVQSARFEKQKKMIIGMSVASFLALLTGLVWDWITAVSHIGIFWFITTTYPNAQSIAGKLYTIFHNLGVQIRPHPPLPPPKLRTHVK